MRRVVGAELSHYTAFGLRIASEIELPELPPGGGEADVTIRRGPVPERLVDPVTDGVLFQAAPGRLRLEVPNVATFLACDGTDVSVAAVPGVDASEVRLFLYGSVLGAILQQRRILTLHASAVTDGERAVLFAGPSGHGKSTLAASFLDGRWRLLTDDVVAVRTDPERGALAAAAYPEIKLWADAMRRLEIDADGLQRVRAELDKAYVPAHDHFATEPVPVSHVYVLYLHNRDDFELTPMTGKAKLNFLIRNTYRLRFLDGLGGKDVHFEACVALSQRAEVVRVLRPRADFRIDELRERIETDLERTAVP